MKERYDILIRSGGYQTTWHNQELSLDVITELSYEFGYEDDYIDFTFTRISDRKVIDSTLITQLMKSIYEDHKKNK